MRIGPEGLGPRVERGSPWNIVPGPRCRMGDAMHVFSYFSDPDFLIQGVDRRHKILLGTSVGVMTAATIFCWAHLFVQPPQARYFAGHICLCNDRRHKTLLGTSPQYFAGHICLCNHRRHDILLGTYACVMTAGRRFCWAHLFVQPPPGLKSLDLISL